MISGTTREDALRDRRSLRRWSPYRVMPSVQILPPRDEGAEHLFVTGVLMLLIAVVAKFVAPL